MANWLARAHAMAEPHSAPADAAPPINKPAILGELSAALPKITGEHLPNVPPSGHLGKRDVLTDAGISSSSANEYERIAAIPESDFEAHIAEHRDAREQATELRELVGIVAADWPDDERAEALAAALADPEAALVCFRALAAERKGATADRQELAPADMRPCVDCASYTPSGRCLAAWRGESFGAGIATSRTWTPAEPERPQRCGAYSPGPNDPDKRTGRERWPILFASVEARR